MPTPISVETWAVIGQWLIYGGSLAGAVAAIFSLAKKIRSKTSMARLEETVEQHTQYLDNDNKRLNALEAFATESKEDRKDIHTVERLNLVAVQALLKSNLENGNNRSGMQDAYNKIQEFLNNQV